MNLAIFANLVISMNLAIFVNFGFSEKCEMNFAFVIFVISAKITFS